MRVRFAIVALILSLGASRRAEAHEGLKKSTPASGEVVTTRLKEIRLEFTEKPELAFTSLRLVGPDSATISLGRETIVGNSIVVPLMSSLAAGSYTLRWKTAGKDGHPASGNLRFSVAAAAAPILSTTDSALIESRVGAPATGMHHDPSSMPAGGAFDSQSVGYIVLRWLQYVAVLTLVGAFAFAHVVIAFLRRRNHDSQLVAPMRTRAERAVIVSACALMLIAVLRLIAQSYAMHGENQSVLTAMWPMITGTTWGIAWLLQLLGAAFVLAVFLSRRLPSEARWLFGVAGLLAVIISLPLSGHAASAPHLKSLAVASDSVHIIGAGGWLGSLLMVLTVGIPVAMRLEPDDRNTAIASVVNAFSPTALIFASTAGLTGLFAAWLHIGSIRAIVGTAYGRTLLLKLGVLSIVVLTGAYNWLRIKPSLGKVEATKRLRFSATLELCVALVVIAVTAVLVATPTAIDEEMMRTPTSSPPR